MKLRLRAIGWSLSAVVGGAALFAVACSTTADNGDAGSPDPEPTGTTTATAPPPKPDSGVRPPADAATRPDSSTPVDAAIPSDAGDGGLLGDGSFPDCGVVPTLRSPDAGDGGTSFYCPFAEGGAPYCSGDQTCCSGTGSGAGGFDPTMCVPGKVECAAGPKGPRSRWQCGSPANCPGAAPACCIPGTDAGAPAVDTEKVSGRLCPAEFQRGFYIGGTACRSACNAGELTVCSRDADCTAPKKCAPFATNNRDLGYCK